MKNIVIVGFMGTGKTVIAKRLAEEMKRSYVSTDDLIEKKENRTIRAIFREEGEPYFRGVEKEVIKEVASRDDQVIDAGGGVVLDSENVDTLKKTGIMVCLWAQPKTIYERTREYGHRPLLNVEDPEGKIKELLDYRRPFYEKADHHIDTTELNIDEIISRIRKIASEA